MVPARWVVDGVGVDVGTARAAVDTSDLIGSCVEEARSAGGVLPGVWERMLWSVSSGTARGKHRLCVARSGPWQVDGDPCHTGHSGLAVPSPDGRSLHPETGPGWLGSRRGVGVPFRVVCCIGVGGNRLVRRVRGCAWRDDMRWKGQGGGETRRLSLCLSFPRGRRLMRARRAAYPWLGLPCDDESEAFVWG